MSWELYYGDNIQLYMLEIDILKKFSQKYWVSWGVMFYGLGVQKKPRCPAG